MVRVPRQERARATVSAMLQATEQLLREGESLTTNRIAERAGVSIGSLYQYFPDKKALVTELALRRRRALRERMVGLLFTSDNPIEAAIGAMIEVLMEDPELQIALTRQAIQAGIETVLGELPQIVTLVAGYLRAQELPVEDPEMTARVVVTAVVGAVHGAHLTDPELLLEPAFKRTVVAMVERTVGLA